ncbi:PTS system beta-glucoside-specific IIA component, Glc family /PTS system beta-glucoside-specific IIB component, Glc family /PTS system beta-glucoside-specific IIC component, Glc family [Fontibacillus panacisegetis]|uniref:PTS system beta-glucoside-specific IIA component, Glc family /PTS system beta-glucoside-specific IIB component, Glc family /PTS system beta-glucoside-specific IIC component, Glc family n=1 Tax=Fontibacillus panacisegetis TaxID=670482 RepID=A0A1G7F307_9BACL|nr:beta-glucoside-specific PTS transporter subunit IIABC [Fontibacillus panacisegetis]SDE70279.1 PTS system beta-glucoside-specific IIA component, Glc family /PTS system beta-glucoside-specific IIB component, Glc family /PTS system beta-glucoside-specific IIC component, Glc family [Fontibacillus panacisegetis]
MENRELAKKIISLVGGGDNISQHWHCITRLRFNLVEDEKAKIEEINQMEGVIGSQFSGGQFQVIIGAKVADIYEELEKQLIHKNENLALKNKKKLGFVDTIFDVISGIFTPILPAIVGSGLIKGIMALFVVFGWVSTDSSSYAVLNIFSDAVFYFLPFLVAITAARKFNTKESLAVVLAAILLYPTIVNGAADGLGPMNLFGLSIPLNSYTSSVLPIILGVLLLSYVNKWIDKIIPKSLNIVFSPLLTLLITAPLLLAFIAPIGNFLGKYLEVIFTAMFDTAGPIAGLLMGGLMPIIVITGMHYAFFPSTFASLQKLGYDIMLLPMNLVANISQAAAVLGVLIKSKKSTTKSLAFSTLIPAFFGITEPAIYGVTLRLKKPFYASVIGGAAGGAVFGSLAVKTTAFSIPGITALPTYIISNSNNFTYALIGCIVSFIVSLSMTLILGFEEEDSKTIKDNPDKTQATTLIPTETKEVLPKQPAEIYSPLEGDIRDVSSVSDATFSKQKMGKGVAIFPIEGIVYAPFNGTISTMTRTNHALGLTSDDGVELLIHVGIDTVKLKGSCFEALVSENEKIKTGQPILKFDLKEIENRGFDVTTMVIVTNSFEYLDVITTEEQRVEPATSKLMMCVQ